jgi:two-component system sensor histidine kinase ChiS
MPANSPRPGSPLVLVADDHEDSRTIARLVLETAGWRVIEARTGPETLRLVYEARPDALLLDIVMPGLSGWEVARQLRADASCKSTVIIALTALAGSQDRDQSLAAGCDDLLTKPVHPRTLLATLQQHVGETPA